MSFAVISSDYDPIPELVSMALNRNEVALGSSKKASEIAENRLFGFTEGICYGIAAILTQERARHYHGLTGWIEEIPSYEVNKLFRGARSAYKDAAGNKEDRDKIFDEFVQSLRNMIRSDNLDERLEEHRRQLILAGEQEPTPEDSDWLYEEREKFAAVVNPYDEALKKLKDHEKDLP